MSQGDMSQGDMSQNHRRDLARIQRWMQSVITHPGGIEAGLDSDRARDEIDVGADQIETVILPSRARTSVERLEVYGNAYFSRLLECMREFFPATVQVLGEDLFDQFAFAYLQRSPSGSYTLSRLADRFVPFLEETRDQFLATESASDGPAENWADFYVDLARLEWNIEQVFDGPGVEHQSLFTAKDLAAVGKDRWPEARLIPVVCLQILAFQYPVNDYYSAFRKQQAPAIPAPAKSYLVLTRRDYVVWRFAISEPQFDLLTAIAQGAPVGAAIARAAERVEDLDEFANSLQSWFRLWAAEGFIERIDLD